MASIQHTYWVAEANDVRTALQKRIAIALEGETPKPVSFLAVAPMHYVHEKLLHATLRDVLAGSNSRHGVDWIVREAESYCFYVALGADFEYLLNETDRIQKACDGKGMRITGSAMYLPKEGTIEDKAREVYECLSNGVADHRRKMPFIYPNVGSPD